MLRNFLIAAGAAALAASLSAGAPAAAGTADTAAFEALVDRARAVPPEFSADALLRLAGAAQAAPAMKRALLEEAFRRASGAQHRLRRRAASPALRTGAAGYLDRAFAQELDATSLQCRAVRAMLPLDRRKAREMFVEIPRPQLRRGACDDPLVDDVSAWYETLAQVASSSFTQAEIARDRHFELVSAWFAGLQSPVEAGPAAHLLATAPLKPAQFAALLATYSGSLKELAGDDRAFTFAVSPAGRTGRQVAALAARCAKLDVSPLPLIEAYRAFLVRHLGGERCADSADSGGATSFGIPNPELAREADPVAHFNRSLRPEQVKPIEPGEVQPAKLQGAAGGPRPCDSPECRHLSQRYNALLFSPEGVPYSNVERSTTEWQGRLKQYLAEVAEWKDDSMLASGAQFRQKCLLYSDLFNLAPNSPERVMVLRDFLEYLQRTSAQRENRAEWFLAVNSVVARVSLDPAGLRDIWDDMLGSRDAVIALYTALEQLAPRDPGERISIL